MGHPLRLTRWPRLAVPEPRLITIQPWDTSVIGEIEKAILKSELGVTPTSDGKIIRITIPRLTEERRKELVKVVKKDGRRIEGGGSEYPAGGQRAVEGVGKEQEDLSGSAPPVDG